MQDPFRNKESSGAVRWVVLEDGGESHKHRCHNIFLDIQLLGDCEHLAQKSGEIPSRVNKVLRPQYQSFHLLSLSRVADRHPMLIRPHPPSIPM